MTVDGTFFVSIGFHKSVMWTSWTRTPAQSADEIQNDCRITTCYHPASEWQFPHFRHICVMTGCLKQNRIISSYSISFFAFATVLPCLTFDLLFSFSSPETASTEARLSFFHVRRATTRFVTLHKGLSNDMGVLVDEGEFEPGRREDEKEYISYELCHQLHICDVCTIYNMRQWRVISLQELSTAAMDDCSHIIAWQWPVMRLSPSKSPKQGSNHHDSPIRVRHLRFLGAIVIRRWHKFVNDRYIVDC